MAAGTLPRSLEDLLDKIEDRLRDAPLGLHVVGDPADADALEASPIAPEYRALWTRWDGMDLGQNETIVLALADVVAATEKARGEGWIAEGDVVIGERGHDALVLAADPYEEGADVLLVDDEGERLPYASSVPHLVLGALADISVLYDREGEFQGELFGDDGELVPEVERRMLRRRLDADPDAPLARVELARSLRENGEFTAARVELKRVLKVAPEFSRAHYELGRTAHAAGHPEPAARAFRAAAACERDDGLGAYYLAWGALTGAGDRAAVADEVRRRWPGFAAAQADAVRDALARERPERAREHLDLGLAVAPTDVGLLALRRELGSG